MNRIVAGVVLTGLMLGGLGAVPANAATRIAPPPTSTELSTATNALMRTTDVTGVLKAGVTAKDAYRVGYINPPGGQDPLPVCVYAPRYTTLSIPLDSAVGYGATYGTITQDVYAYEDATAAQKAWSKLSSKIPGTCRGSFTDGDSRSTVTSARLPGASGGPAGWGVLDVSSSSVKYSALHLVGEAIQMVTYTEQRASVRRGTTTAVAQLAGTLAGRWVDRRNAPMTQDATLTKAENVMLAPADVPAALPVVTPAKGGWSDFTSYVPEVYLFGCFGVMEKLRASASFSVGLGGSGDVFPGAGSIGQAVYSFGSAEAARATWTRLTKEMATCSENSGRAVPASGDFRREDHGVSALTFGGVPGLWSREVEREDGSQGTCSDASGPVTCDSWSVTSYTIYLLVDDTIQSVGYSTGVLALRPVQLDQLAVNVLAEQLANRWVDAAL